MTVAAVVLAASSESALADADGLARVRRIADSAWSGGALPIVIGSFDPEGSVAAALAGAPVTLSEPAPVESGPVGQIVRAIEVAQGLVAETDAALVWPARMCWVGPETVTSLLEAHGTDPDPILAPSYRGETGWPRLVPLAHLGALRAQATMRMPDQLFADLAEQGIPVRLIELGDPGTVIDGDTARAELPPYEGPEEPASGHAHEWGADVADEPEDAATLEVVRYRSG